MTKIYIVDKDFDDLLGKIVVRPNLFYLDRNCIENYMIEDAAVLQVAIESQPREKAADIGGRLDVPATVGGLFGDLCELFRLFVVVQKYELGIRNCGLSPEVFCIPGKLWKLSVAALSEYREEVRRAALQAGIAGSVEEVDGIVSAAFVSEKCRIHVSGKFVLKMLWHQLRKVGDYAPGSFDSFCYRLSRLGTLGDLLPVKGRIEHYLSSIKSGHPWSQGTEGQAERDDGEKRTRPRRRRKARAAGIAKPIAKR